MEATKNKAKKQKSGFFPKLLDTSIVIVLGSMLTGRWTIRADEGPIEQIRVFSDTSYCNYFRNTKIISKCT